MNIPKNSNPNQVAFVAKTQLINARSKTAAKETALKKRLNTVFENCEIVFILANSKSHLQSTFQVFDKSFLQKSTFPKHALNNYCLNFHMPIQGCHLDLLVLCKNPEKKPSNLSTFTTSCHLYRPGLDGMLKTHMAGVLCGELFKIEKQAFRSLVPNQISLGHPWHFNQLVGAFVKDENQLIFYIGHAEIKQTLLLQQHLKQFAFIDPVLPPKLLMLQSFRETFSKLELLLLMQSRSHFRVLNNLVSALQHLKLNLLLFLDFKTKAEIKQH
uniref:Uncharacterized protein n=1 Tax=Gloeotilopsis planctonica TaxID=34157 RepID=A0A1B2RZ12_9CHLO|nr:hypothetical protein [Gloeotilopsis planctonica]